MAAAILAVGISCADSPDPSTRTRTADLPSAEGAALDIATLTETFERDGRALRTVIWVPEGRGPFPIVLFSHGLGALPESFRPLLVPWVRDGFVVIGPIYPHTNGRGDLDAGDLVNQPADASFVLDSVLELASEGDDRLSGRLDPERIAAVGHSMGGMTTIGLVSECCADDRIDGGVVYAGETRAFGDEGFVLDPPPLLFIHGDQDAVVSYERGREAYRMATGPKAFITLAGADHTGAFFGDPGEHGAVVAAATLAFLRWTLRDDERARDDLRRATRRDSVGFEDDLS